MATAKMIPIIILLLSLTFDVSNSIKWYFYNSSLAHHTQKRNEDLWNYGCCQDTIGCRGNGPKYLGMDVFMRAYRYINDDSYRGLRDYVLMIHQVNYMVSNVFGSNYLPSEESIGKIGSPIEDDWWRRKLNAQCLQLGRNESAFITGFSVRVSNEAFFVCGDKVTKVNSTVQEHSDAWNRTVACQCKNDNCQGLHPVFCDNGPEKLISIAAVPSKPNDENPYLYGFYSTHSNHETGKTPRNYTVKVWRYHNYKKDPIHSTSSFGYLTEVDTFKDDNNGYYGMYFTVDGNACPFYRKYSDDWTIKEQSDLSFEYFKTPRQPCLSFQMFIGCPQPWCFSNRVDASFTVPDIYDVYSYIYLAVGNYVWQVEDGDLPLKPPRVEEAKKPIRAISTSYSDRHNPCQYYLDDQEMPYCAIPNIGAAFAYQLERIWYIVYYSTSENSLYYHKAWTREGQNNSIPNPFKSGYTADKSYWYDAFWPNLRDKAAYGFFGQKYEKFNITQYPPKYIDFVGDLNEFHLEVPVVDAVVNRGDKGYFFYNNFYYEVQAYDWRQQTSLPKIFAMKNFFAIQKECYANDKEAYEELISRFIPLNYTTGQPSGGGSGEHSIGSTQETISRGDGGGQSDVSTRETISRGDGGRQSVRSTQDSTTTAQRSPMNIFYIIVPAIIIVLGVVACMFIFGTMAGRKGRPNLEQNKVGGNQSNGKQSTALKGETPSSPEPKSVVGPKANEDTTKESKIIKV